MKNIKARAAKLSNEAAKLFDVKAYDKLYANPRGEFFTSENLGKLSLREGEELIAFDKKDFVLKATPEVASKDTERKTEDK